MIVAVAVKLGQLIYTMPRPNRHYNVMHRMSDEKIPLAGREQGFLTDKGEFLDRDSAALHAIECGQITECKFVKNHLFSEDLW